MPAEPPKLTPARTPVTVTVGYGPKIGDLVDEVRHGEVPEPKPPIRIPKRRAKRKKGNVLEKRAKKRLKRLGYGKVHQVRAAFFWRGPKPRTFSNDMFHAFDLNGLHPICPPIWVQVTTHMARSARRRKVEQAVRAESHNLHHDFQLWSYGYQKRLGHHLHVERLWNGAWVPRGNFRYDDTEILD